ncbi:MAG: type II secretion system F family protein [Armatimonadetes bacterium]|nr:type II secretion system F family protein [Armatimonadota bacterium]
MPLYRYQAQDKTGTEVHGVMDERSEEVVSRRLQQMGYVTTAITRASLSTASKTLGTATAPASRLTAGPADLARFYGQLMMCWQAGLPAFQALSEVATQVAHRSLAQAAVEMAHRVQAGTRLEDAMAAHPCLFSPGDVGLVRAAEMGGFVVEALQELAAQHDADARAMAACRLPFIYLACLLFLGLLLVLPAVEMLRTTVRTESATLGAQAAVRVVLTHWLPVVLASVALVWLVARFVKAPSRRRWWHSVLLRVPVVGGIAWQRSRAAFSAALRLLYHGGVGPGAAWEAAADAAPNRVLAERLRLGAAEVHAGRGFAPALDRTGVFSAIDVGLVATGERAGKIEQALAQIAADHHTAAEQAIQRLPGTAYGLALGIGAIFVAAMVAYGALNYVSILINGITAE